MAGSMLTEFLPRQQVIPELASVQRLIAAPEGWVRLRPEQFFTRPRAENWGRYTQQVEEEALPFKSQMRVPALCLSKYHNALMTPYQFIVAQSGIGSGDSFEELVSKDANFWFDDALSFDVEGQSVCYPRLASNPHWRHRNWADLGFAADMPIETIADPVLSISAWYGSNICHWLHDLFPRLMALNHLKYLDGIRVAFADQNAPFANQALEVLGIRQSQILPLRDDRNYRFSQLYTLARPIGQYEYFSPEAAAFYRDLRGRISGFKRGGDRILYASRRDSQRNRPCTNEVAFEAALMDRGIRPVIFSNLSFIQRLEVMAGAELLLGPLGAGMAHAIMMNDYTTVMAFGAPRMLQLTIMLSNLAAIKKQRVIRVGCIGHGMGARNDEPWEYDMADALAQVDRLLETV